MWLWAVAALFAGHAVGRRSRGTMAALDDDAATPEAEAEAEDAAWSPFDVDAASCGCDERDDESEVA